MSPSAFRRRYRAEKDHCRRFPGPASADLRGGPRRNFQVFTALDFLAELTQHIPDKGEHLVRYYGWYSHRHRGMRAKPGSGSFSCRHQTDASVSNDVGKKTCLTPSDVTKVSDPLPRAGSVSTWAMLIKRVYEVDPLECPKCGGRMKIIGFIERRQHEVIERILRWHQSGAMVGGLWEGPLRTLANPRAPPRGPPRAADAARDLELVPDAEFLESERLETRLESQPTQARELQLVLDPEYL